MKDKSTAAILALFMGGLGVHKFYLGRIGAGLVYLVFSLTFIPAILGLIDFFILALMDPDEFNRRYNGTALGPASVVVNMLPPGHYPQAGYYPPGQYPPGQYPPGQYPPGYYPPGVVPPPGYPQQPQAARAPRSADELARELEKLNELRIAGLLTDDEFNAQKAKLLASM
ncbi:MAG: NINE protein [Nannocystaceae bacterium]|nr:NINE protein [Nannocystaceae bacterium]